MSESPTDPPGIPPPRYGRKDRNEGRTNELRALKVGDYIETPRQFEGSYYMPAKRLGITIAKRRMGSETTTRIYRVA